VWERLYAAILLLPEELLSRLKAAPTKQVSSNEQSPWNYPSSQRGIIQHITRSHSLTGTPFTAETLPPKHLDMPANRIYEYDHTGKKKTAYRELGKTGLRGVLAHSLWICPLNLNRIMPAEE